MVQEGRDGDDAGWNLQKRQWRYQRCWSGMGDAATVTVEDGRGGDCDGLGGREKGWLVKVREEDGWVEVYRFGN